MAKWPRCKAALRPNCIIAPQARNTVELFAEFRESGPREELIRASSVLFPLHQAQNRHSIQYLKQVGVVDGQLLVFSRLCQVLIHHLLQYVVHNVALFHKYGQILMRRWAVLHALRFKKALECLTDCEISETCLVLFHLWTKIIINYNIWKWTGQLLVLWNNRNRS